MRISAGERARWADDRTTGVPTKGREPRGLFVFLQLGVNDEDRSHGGPARRTAGGAVMSTLAISFDPLRVDRARVHGWLSQEAYWSIGLGRTVFERAVEHSLVASAYLDDEQVGFARVVTDRATFRLVVRRLRCAVQARAGHRNPADSGGRRAPGPAGTAPLGPADAGCARALRAFRLHGAGRTAARDGEAQSTRLHAIGQ